jgi:UDP-glucose 4-epimerase
MKILITGGAGFIGSHLSHRLVDEGHRVTVFDNLSTGLKSNIADLIGTENFTFVEGTILDEPTVIQVMKDKDLVIHLAASVGVKLIMDEPLKSIINNLTGTENVLKIANKNKIKTIIASTSEVYGKNSKVPFSESDDRIMGPTQKTRWSYAESKALDEFIALAYYHEESLPVVITRFFNVIGPKQRSEYGMVVPRFISKALRGQDIEIYGDGNQSRCFSYIDDVVEALVRLINCDKAVGEVINVGCDREISINELADMVIKLTESKSKVTHIDPEKVYGEHFEDMQIRKPDLKKIKNLVNWSPSTTIDLSIKSIIESGDLAA